MPERIFPKHDDIPGETKLLALSSITRKYTLSATTDEQERALKQLCNDFDNACDHLEGIDANNPFIDDGLGRCYALALQCWHISPDEKLPRSGDEQLRIKILSWLLKWRERFFGWRDHPELETQPRMLEITRFLQIWLAMDLSDHTDERRGCPNWLMEKGFLKEGQGTEYDDWLKRHKILENG